jgi:uncharacterized protein (DUF1330 family)
MAGYILLDLEITDPESFKEYLKLGDLLIAQKRNWLCGSIAVTTT